jgi:hypothetical protein
MKFAMPSETKPGTAIFFDAGQTPIAYLCRGVVEGRDPNNTAHLLVKYHGDTYSVHWANTRLIEDQP